MTQFPLPPGLMVDLQHIEAIVRERTRPRATVISAAAAHLLLPEQAQALVALVLMSAQTGVYQLERVVHAAAAIKLIHAATQTHNALIDEAERRRGVARVGEWNHGVALMVGDYLFALAAGEMSQSPDPRVIDFYSNAVTRITEATLAAPVLPGPLEEARARYLEGLAGKGALYTAACMAGGACGGLTATQIEALGRFGEQLGLALHLGDECNEFADPVAGASLGAGLVTLPLIYAVAHGDSERLVLALDSADPDELTWASREVQRHGLAAARAEVARLVEQARAALDDLPTGEACAALMRVSDYALARAG